MSEKRITWDSMIVKAEDCVDCVVISKKVLDDLERYQAIVKSATEIQGDDEVLKYVTSGNANPVTRCTVSADFIRQLVDARRPALPLSQPRVEWQPIETAPRDGTAIDLWVVEIFIKQTYRNNGYRIVNARWGTSWKYMYDSKETFDGWAYSNEIYTHAVERPLSGGEQYATHWQPLPEPPDANVGQE